MSERQAKNETRGNVHPLVGGMALVAAIVGVVAVGAWGLAAPRGHEDLDTAAEHSVHGQSAGAAESITFPGGRVTVDRVIDVDLSMPMQGPGMSMPMGSGVPQVPKGYRLIDVEISLRALAGGGLPFDARKFQVQGPGFGPTRPQPTEEAQNLIPQGGLLSRTLTFQVPEAAQELELTVEGGDRPLQLKLGPAPPDGHGGH